jgi:hypothetical protein
MCRLRVFENRMLRILFEPKGDEVRGKYHKHVYPQYYI